MARTRRGAKKGGEHEAKRRIEEAARTGATSLSLSYLGLETLPPEIGQLTALNILDLASNELTSLPPQIGELTALMSLSLRQNQLTSLPAELGGLAQLLYGHPARHARSAAPCRTLEGAADARRHDRFRGRLEGADGRYLVRRARLPLHSAAASGPLRRRTRSVN